MKKKNLVLTLCLVLTAREAAAHDIIASRYSYREHVLPIFEAHCVRCHSPDGPAPFLLTNYRDARPRAIAIKEEILLKNMPPWYAEAGQRELIGEHRLSSAELDIIVEWASGGAPEGKGVVSTRVVKKKKAPGIADSRLPFPEMALAPGRSRKTVEWKLKTGLNQPVWITAWRLGAARPDLLRSVSLYRGERAPENYLGTRSIVDEKLGWPATGAELKAGQDLVVEVLYTRPWRLGNRKESVRGELRLWISKTRPDRLLQARALSQGDGPPTGASLLAIHPSTPLSLTVSERGGNLIEVFATPANWPLLYRFNEPVKITGELGTSPKAGGILLYSVP